MKHKFIIRTLLLNNNILLKFIFYIIRLSAKDTDGVILCVNPPPALMLDISEDNFEITLQAVRQAKAMIAFNNMRSRAAAKGFMSDEEIEAEITAAKERRISI